jgi:hypothetical protein
MPPKKANKGAFGKGNQGYGLRNAAVDAADEPDAAGPEAQGEVCCARTICPLFVQGTSGLRIRDGLQKGARASAARRGYVVTALATTSIAESYALGGPMKDRLYTMAYSGGDRSHSKWHA